MRTPSLALGLNAIPIGAVDDGWIVVLDRRLRTHPLHTVHVFADEGNKSSDHSRRSQKMSDEALLPNPTALIAMTEERNLPLIQLSCDCLMSDASQHIPVNPPDDIGSIFHDDELSCCLVEVHPGHLDDHGFSDSWDRLTPNEARIRRDFISLSSFARIMLTSETMRSRGFWFRLASE
jgi:hypothetical protein